MRDDLTRPHVKGETREVPEVFTKSKKNYLKPGECIGKFEIVGELGRGGMGIVYLAKDPKLKRNVAIKTTLGGEHASEEMLDRFEREAQSIAQLRHPNIVAVYDYGEQKGMHYIAMDFVKGSSLEDLINEEHAMGERQSLKIIHDAAMALDHAHMKGIIHRDIKPANILIDEEGNPKVTDFGLAKKVDADKRLTQSGFMMGTPAYMPPEQVEGANVDGRADVWSLGATLYEMLTGTVPFDGENMYAICNNIIVEEPKPPRKLNHQISKDAETIILTALEKDLNKRYECAYDFAEDLRRLLEGEHILARPTTRAERLGRKIKKHPKVAAGLATGLILAIGFGTWGYSKILEQSILAEKEKQKTAEIQKQKDLEEKSREAEKALKDKAWPIYVRAKQIIERAYQARSQGSLEDWVDSSNEGLDKIDEALAIYTDFSEALYLQGRTWKSRNDFGKALSKLNKAIELNEKDPSAYYERALVYLKMFRDSVFENKELTAKAEENLRSAIRLGLENDHLFHAQAILLQNNKDFELALKHINTALELNKYFAHGYLVRGSLQVDLNNPEQAMEDYNRAVKLDPLLEEAHTNKGALYASREQYDLAEAEYKKALEINPKSLFPTVNLGLTYFTMGHHDLALQHLNTALQANPKIYTARLHKAAIIESSNPNQSEKIYSSLIEEAPSRSKAYIRLAVFYAKQGKTLEALDVTEQALQNCSEDKELFEKLKEKIKK